MKRSDISNLPMVTSVKRYSCDGGSICIGNKSSRACFPNGYGDGNFYVGITLSHASVPAEWTFAGCVRGTDLVVYDSDCYYDDEIADYGECIVLFHLSGRYGVYYNDGNILLEKWD